MPRGEASKGKTSRKCKTNRNEMTKVSPLIALFAAASVKEEPRKRPSHYDAGKENLVQRMTRIVSDVGRIKSPLEVSPELLDNLRNKRASGVRSSYVVPAKPVVAGACPAEEFPKANARKLERVISASSHRGQVANEIDISAACGSSDWSWANEVDHANADGGEEEEADEEGEEVDELEDEAEEEENAD